MTRPGIREKMALIAGIDSGVNLFFAIKQKDGEVAIKKADLADGDTQKHLKEQFISLLQEDFPDNEEEEVQILELSNADERKNVFYHYDMKEFPESLRYFADFDYQKSYPEFSFGSDDLIDIVAFLIAIGTQEQYCVLYKRFYPIFLLGRGSYCLLPSKHRFQEFNNEILRVDRNYQFIRIDGEIYIKDIDVLEKFSDFKALVQSEAIAAVEEIEGLKLLEEADGLRESLMEDVSFARKLCKVKKTSPVLALHIPRSQIIEFSKTHPGLAGKMRYNEDGNRIVLTSKKSQQLFIKLLDDSYLTSQLTKLFYDSRAKDRVGNSGQSDGMKQKNNKKDKKRKK